jgi:putative ABC transport system permease protein
VRLPAVFRIPLGWLQLKREKLRFAVALLGVAFAVILILMQLGFREAMFGSAVRYHESLRYDVVLVSPESPLIVQPRSFSNRRLYQARGVPGVASVTPVYLGLGQWKNPVTLETRSIFVVGFDPADPVLPLPEVESQRERITASDAILFDDASRPEFGPIPEWVHQQRPVAIELNNRVVNVAGLFRFGTSFGIDGSVLTSDTNFLRLFPNRQRGLIELGLVRVEPGQDPGRVRDAIRAALPDDVLVLTKADYAAKERRYWDVNTPIGYVFAFGVAVGLVVGGIVVYQILFADVNDHLAEYATLKAMGYSNRFLSAVVIQQAVILAVVGYLPGLAICLLLYRISSEATRLPLEMTWPRGLGVLGLTIGMCAASALMALRKVRSADPADVF